MKPSTRFRSSLGVFALAMAVLGFCVGVTADAAMDGGDFAQLLPGCGMGLLIATLSIRHVLAYGGPRA